MARRRDNDPNWTAISFELEKSLYEGLRAIAQGEHRTVAGELRRLIEERIAEYDEQKEAA